MHALFAFVSGNDIYSFRFFCVCIALVKDGLIMCKWCLTVESNFMMRLNTEFGEETAWSHRNKLIYCFFLFCQYYNNTIATKVLQLELALVSFSCLLLNRNAFSLTPQTTFSNFLASTHIQKRVHLVHTSCENCHLKSAQYGWKQFQNHKRHVYNNIEVIVKRPRSETHTTAYETYCIETSW